MKASKGLQKIISILKSGGIGVLPTDTIYGVMGSALDKKTIARLYEVRKRKPTKPFIILIAAPKDIEKFGVSVSAPAKSVLSDVWPGPVSVILPVTRNKESFKYLHRGTNSLAFRLPAKKALLEILRETGPLAAPSANIEGFPPSKNLKEARKYFGDKVDFYQGGASRRGKPSRIIKISGRTVEIIR